MPDKNKNKHLKLVKDYVVKCRLEQSTGSVENPEIHRYYTYIITATSPEAAIEEATIRAGAEADYPYVVKIEYITGGA